MGRHVVTKEEEGAYGVFNGTIEIEMNWYCPQFQPQKLVINGDDKEFRGFYVLEGETITVLSPYMVTFSESHTFAELGRVVYTVTFNPFTITDYTLPGRRYE